MHKCIKCAKIYEDDQVPLFTGCGCGSKFFVTLKPGQEDEIESLIGASDEELNALKNKTDLEILKVEQRTAAPQVSAPSASAATAAPTTPKAEISEVSTKASFGVETVKMSKPGVYDINIEALLCGKPVVIFSNGRTYIIQLATAFKEVVKNVIE